MRYLLINSSNILCIIISTVCATGFSHNAMADDSEEEAIADTSVSASKANSAKEPKDDETDQGQPQSVREILDSEAESVNNNSKITKPEVTPKPEENLEQPNSNEKPLPPQKPKPSPQKMQIIATPLGSIKPLPSKIDIETYVSPSEQSLLESMGLTKSPNYEKAIKLLESRLHSNYKSANRRSYNKNCANILKGSAEIFNPANLDTLACFAFSLEQNAIEQPKLIRSTRQSRVLTAAQWASLSESSFTTAWAHLKFSTKDELLKLMGYFRNTPALCPYRNVGVAIIAHAESLLPDEAIVGVTEEIYQKTANCLKPEEEGYERAHLRAGLHRLGRDDESGAKIALQKAILATNPKERYRALFWLGAIELREQEAKGTKSMSNSVYWNMLLREFPLEIHSIIAAKMLDKDPLEKLLDTKPMFASRRTSENWTTSNGIAVVTEVLLARKNMTTINAWFNFLTTVYTTRNPEELLFLGLTANRSEQYLPSIIFLTRYLREVNSIKLNMEFLRIYFPIPFAKEILANSRTVDPVLIFALIRQESAFNSNARSGANARGLMQILPTTARLFERVSLSSLNNATINTRIGVKYVESLMKTYQGKAEHVLSAYNAGPQNINRWQVRYSVEQDLLFADLIPFKETRGYVSSILRNAYWYGRILTFRSDEIGKTTLQKSASANWRSTVVRNLLEVAWNSKAETAQELKNIKNIFRLSKTVDGTSSKEKAKNTVVQEFPSLSDEALPPARQ